MTGNKTVPNAQPVAGYLEAIDDPDRRAECEALGALFEAITGAPPRLWGDAIVGFGSYRYRYDSGREGEWLLLGYAARKAGLSVYLGCDLADLADLRARLGRHGAGRSCLNLRRLADVDLGVLEQMARRAVARTLERYPQ